MVSLTTQAQVYTPGAAKADGWYCHHIQTLELMEGKNLFNPIDRVHNQYVLPLALAQYIGYLGPPPLEMIRQSPLFSTYFDENGKYRNSYLSRFFCLKQSGQKESLTVTDYCNRQLDI